jgi:hypothetical protein
VFGRAPAATSTLAPPRTPHHVRGRHHTGSSATIGRKAHATTTSASSNCTTYLCLSNKAGRLHNLRVALHLIHHHPLGTGLGTFGSAGALAFHVKLKGVPKNFYADNQYTVILVETGLPGALLFAILGIATFLAILRMRSRNGGHDRRLLLSLFIGMVILGATSNAWEQLVLTLYPWLALAAFLPLMQERQSDASTPQGGGLKAASAGP